MKKLVGIGILALLFGCNKPPIPPDPIPTPTPTPTPTPIPPIGTPVGGEKLLRQESSPPRLHLNDAAKTPFEVVQYIPCCKIFSPESVYKLLDFKVDNQILPTLWPLVSPEFINYTKTRGSANFFHRRFGPFLVSQEPEWVEYGGPYLVGGQVNQKFWNKNREITNSGIAGNYWFEDVIFDSWAFKNSQAGNAYVDMSPEAIAAFGHFWHPEHEKYLAIYVQNLGCFGNTIIALDNEGELIRNYDPNFYRTMLARYRELEKTLGCNFVHMVGTSVHELFNEVDYTITHERSPLLSPIASKWTINNEHNPEFTPEEEADNFQKARVRHLAWSLWRGEASDSNYNKVMDLVKSVVNGDVVGCFAPPPEPGSDWSQPSAPNVPTYPPSSRPTQLQAAFNLAKSKVGNRCGALGSDGTIFGGCLETNSLIAAEIRKQQICASGPWVDATAAKAPDGKYEEWHVCSYGDGCYTGNPYKGAWDYLRETPACNQEVPTIDEILCKPHVPLGRYDCTPKYKGQPILPEDDPNRSACELKAMGGKFPVYSITGPSSLILSTVENPLQFQITGSGQGIVTCQVPVGIFCNTQVSR